MISFYILSKRFFLKREGLSDTRVASVTKKQYGFDIYIYIYIYIYNIYIYIYIFVKIHKAFKVNI